MTTPKSTAEFEVDEEELKGAIINIIDFLERERTPNLLGYMALVSIVKTLEDKFGYGNERRTDS